jgi:hypothetical protein
MRLQAAIQGTGAANMLNVVNKVLHKVFGERVLLWRDMRRRARVERLRRDALVLTTTDATMATLRLHGLLPNPIVALEPFGKFGLRKTLDYAHTCASLDFYEYEETFARHARRLLPSNVTVHCTDSIAAMREGRLPRREYNFVMSDHPFGEIYGKDYCEHFDFFPQLFQSLAASAVIVLNLFIAERTGNLDPRYLARRRAFYGARADAECLNPSFDTVVEVHRRLLPAGWTLAKALAIPHPVDRSRPGEEVYFLVLAVRASAATA